MQSHEIILTALRVILIHKGASSTHVMTDILIVLWHSSTSSSSRAWTFTLTHTFADKLKLAYDMTLIVLRTVWVYVWAACLLSRLARMKMMSLSGWKHSPEKHELAKTQTEKESWRDWYMFYIYTVVNVISVLGDTQTCTCSLQYTKMVQLSEFFWPSATFSFFLFFHLK